MDFRYLQVSKIKEPTIIDIYHIIFSEENVIDNLSVAKPQMSILDTSISRVKTMFNMISPVTFY